jgi:hypothetical protein
MQNYLKMAAVGAPDMKTLHYIAVQPHLRFHAPRVPMVSQLLTIMTYGTVVAYAPVSFG